MEELMKGWMEEWMKERMKGRVEEWMKGRMDGLINEWKKDGWIDGQTDGRIHRMMDRLRMDGLYDNLLFDGYMMENRWMDDRKNKIWERLYKTMIDDKTTVRTVER